ncbi:deoxynucleotidyltransferase terminal-interacting protein 2 isoform X2 [Pleuronectes platessa]|uniref:deoxynucleotidyltransferase terminal-interacting protein 2 isoform X2 n=1 Tax=Pleuronectes platessa TaxID=8262 RepID=UPI00232A3B89|nr:deoxynucleotidyltransferase terminal-interacting protein 2 isoform X2 [Pleuronectes platessa]
MREWGQARGASKMVSTRRGVRVSSPSKTNPDQSSDVPATPSTVRRSRRTAQQAESPTHDALVETSHQLKESNRGSPASSPPSLIKRCTRAARLHSPEQSCTPVDSTHEGDLSDAGSCGSAQSVIELPVTRNRGRRAPPRAVSPEDEEMSGVESCSSVVSASNAGQIIRRSTRKKRAPASRDLAPASPEPAPASPEPAPASPDLAPASPDLAPASPEPASASPDLAMAPLEALEVDQMLETESCSAVASESKRVTRSLRRTARNRSAAKQQTEDSEVSDADSCASSATGAAVTSSTARRSTRSRRSAHGIPINLDEASDCSYSPPRRGQQTRAARGKASVTVDVSDPPSPNSDGFESGPTYSMTTRRRSRAQPQGPKALDSDSDLTDRGTPCSSRTGSGNSSRGVRVTRKSVRSLSIVLNKVCESMVENVSLNDSTLERTLITEDADRTLSEEPMSLTLEEKEDGKEADLTSKEVDTNEEEKEEKEEKEEEKEVVAGTVDLTSNEVDTNEKEEEEEVVASTVNLSSNEVDTNEEEKEVVSEPAVMVKGQQEELSAEKKDENTSEVEMMQEMIESSEPLETCQSVTVTECEEATGIMAEEEVDQPMEAADVGTHSSQGDEAAGEDAVVEAGPSDEEKMEVNTDAQQVVDSSEVQVESIQVTSSQQLTITVDSEPEQQQNDVIVQKTKVISLLDSSDDEEEGDVSGDEEEEEELGLGKEEEVAGPSKTSDSASAAVGGLFMIDTRPGQEADEHYYNERPTEEEEAQNREAEQGEQDEEFVDEEGDDDDDDEDAKILFSCRNPQLKDFSTRIDPGIKMKELGGLYINFGGSNSKAASTSSGEKKIQDEVMKKSVIGPEFEKMAAVPPYSESKQAVKLKNRAERAKCTGDSWFNMKAPELTQELKGDLQVLKMRSTMDPKRFYKKNDRDGFPKYFQVGTVVDNPVDYYHSRIPKKERKRTMVEELLADAEFRHQNKKKYQQILIEKAAQGAGRKNRKKSKFHKK